MKTIEYKQKMLKIHKFTKIHKSSQKSAQKATQNDGKQVGNEGNDERRCEFFTFESCKVYRADIKNGIRSSVRNARATGDIAVHSVPFENVRKHCDRTAAREGLHKQ